jgi:hypothetical protein
MASNLYIGLSDHSAAFHLSVHITSNTKRPLQLKMIIDRLGKML